MVLINTPRHARGSVNRPNVINDAGLPIVDLQILAPVLLMYREIRCRYENYNAPRARRCFMALRIKFRKWDGVVKRTRRPGRRLP